MFGLFKTKDEAEPYVIEREPSLRILLYRQYLKVKKPKHALLSYLSQPVLDHINSGESVRFSNDGLATSWPKVLNQLGYEVDIINWDDQDFKFRENYDLVISHGGINYKNIANQMSTATPYIYFSTGSYWKYHNQQEEARFTDFKRRHGIDLPHDRHIDYPEEEANRRAQAIICLGNDEARKTYANFEHVFNVPIGSFTKNGHSKTKDEIESGRRNVLFIAGAGNIHKGLDLILDALVDMPELTLHIYTFIDESFSKYYAAQLKSPQVVIHEFEAFPNERFLNITKQCNTAIMVSCSEGSPGSIAEAMIQGLIPIVSKESHIDVGDFGLLLPDNSVESIKKALSTITKTSTSELHNKSAQANRTAMTRHSATAFEKSLSQAIQRVERLL